MACLSLPLGPASGGPWALDPLLARLPPGGLFSKTEMSEVLTEILRVDPAFDKERFLQQCENDIIPNVLEVGCPSVGPPCSALLRSPRAMHSTQAAAWWGTVPGADGCPGFRGLSPHAWPLFVTRL